MKRIHNLILNDQKVRLAKRADKDFKEQRKERSKERIRHILHKYVCMRKFYAKWMIVNSKSR